MLRLTYAEAREFEIEREWYEDPALLYRLYDLRANLLYIGITKRLLRDRFNAHSRVKPWWHEVALVGIEREPNVTAALAAERAAIKRELPRYNIRSAVR